MEKGESYSETWETMKNILDDDVMKIRLGLWENIFRTNTQTAYIAGKLQQYENSNVAAYQLMVIENGRTSKICRHLLTASGYGMIISVDHPFWKKYEFPPYHFQCRTSIRAIWPSQVGKLRNMVEWAEEAEESIKGLLKFEFGPPSADTILRVFRNVYADKIEKVFLNWAHGIYEKVKIEPERTIVAIDGKTMCGSNKVTEAKGIHIVSAWADELSLILGQVKTDEKSNEITAIPELIELIDIKGMIITIDAMGCQKKICEKIKEKNADYVLSLKGNQSATHEAVKDFFSMDEK